MFIHVICPTFNRHDKLIRAVESFKMQVTSIPKLLTIIDNGSDIPVDIKTSDEIHLIRHDKNENPCKRINDNIITNTITTLLFDDDMFYRFDSLQKRVQPILDVRANMTYSDALVFGLSNHIYTSENLDTDKIMKSDKIYMGSIAWDQACWKWCGPLREDLWLQSDWIFKIKCFINIACEYVPFITLKSEIHDSNESNTKRYLKEKEDAIVRNLIESGEL